MFMLTRPLTWLDAAPESWPGSCGCALGVCALQRPRSPQGCPRDHSRGSAFPPFCLGFALDPPEQLRVWCGFPVPSSSTASLVLSHTLLQPHRPLGPGSRRERRRTQGAQPLLGPQLFPSERMFLLRALSTCRPPPLPPPAHTAGLPGAQRVQDSSPGGASPPQGSKGSWAPSELTPPPGSRPQSVLCACSPFSLV